VIYQFGIHYFEEKTTNTNMLVVGVCFYLGEMNISPLTANKTLTVQLPLEGHRRIS